MSLHGRDAVLRERAIRIQRLVAAFREGSQGSADADVAALVAAHPDLSPELQRELQKVRLVGAAWELARGNSKSADTKGLIIRCPHCRTPNVITSDTNLTIIICDSCESRFSLMADEAECATDYAGKKVAHFELVEILGRGGFGSVWKARDTELDRMVALKIPRVGRHTDTKPEQMVREARAAAQLRHPNIISVHEVGRDADTVFIVSELVEGESLSEWFATREPTFREAANLCAKLADALQHAHDSGVIHRDIKPQNILIDHASEPHLMDFGLARREVGEITLTMDGHVLGTPAYMSPEQARGESHRADCRTDIYSLGVILFQLLTGELPFRGEPRMITQQLLHEDAPSPRRFNSAVTHDLENITLKCLEKDVERRYSSALELSKDLRRYCEGKPVRARPVSFVARATRWCKRHPASAAALFLLLLLTVGGPFVALRQAQLADQFRRSLYLSDLQSAADALNAGDLMRAVNLLQRYRQVGTSDLRTVEWYLLWQKCQPGMTAPDLCRQLTSAHPLAKQSRRLAYSSRDDLAAAHFDGTLTTWRDGALLHRLPGHGGFAQSVAFSADGAMLASGGDDNTLNIWDVDTGKLVHQIENGRPAWSLAFLDNDVVVAPTDAGLCRWNARTGQRLDAIPNSSFVMNPAVDHGDGRLAVSNDRNLIALSDDRGITIQNLRTNQKSGPWRAHESFAWCLSFSSDDRYLITGGGNQDPTVKIWDVRTQDLVCTFSGHTRRVRAVRMSPADNDLVASVGWDRKVKLWSISQRQEIATLIGHSAQLFAMDFSPDGRTLATGGLDGTIKLWDLANLKKERILGQGSPTALAFHPDGSLVSAGQEGAFFSETESGSLVTHGNRPTGLGVWNDIACSPDGLTYATLASKFDIVLVDYTTHEVQHTLKHESKLNCLAYSPSGRWLATGKWNGKITLWETSSCTAVASWVAHQTQGVDATVLDNFWSQPHMVHDLMFVKDHQLVSIGADKTLRLWTLGSDEEKVLVSEPRSFQQSDSLPRTLALSQDRDLLAVADDFGNISLWHTGTFERITTWFAHTKSGIFSLAFVPPGDTLISGGFDGELRFWGTQTQSLRMTMSGKTGVHAVAVSSDGSKIAWAGGDGAVRLLPTK